MSPPGLTAARLAALSETARAAFVSALSPDEAFALRWSWAFWARPEQIPPAGDWRVWVFLGGRGAGKTRAGAEWVRGLVEGDSPMSAGRCRRVALIGPTLADVREVMVEGPSGLIAVSPPDRRPVYEVSRRRLVWPNGAIAYGFSAEDPDRLRGPQFDAAWADEFAAWRNAQQTYDTLSMGLRLGADPRVIVTTTPRDSSSLKRLLGAPGTAVSRAATQANAAWLAPAFIEAMEAVYGGGRLGRQELGGELIEDVGGAMWNRRLLEDVRAVSPPALTRIAVGVDPPVSVGPNADACGIIVAGLCAGAPPSGWVLSDRSVQGLTPDGWARAVIDAVQAYDADYVVAEVNQGGALVSSVLRAGNSHLVVREVRASRGKRARAEPIAALYEQGRVRHAAPMPRLDDEMCGFGAPGFAGSPDRIDALVWVLSDLMLGRARTPRLRVL